MREKDPDRGRYQGVEGSDLRAKSVKSITSKPASFKASTKCCGDRSSGRPLPTSMPVNEARKETC